MFIPPIWRYKNNEYTQTLGNIEEKNNENKLQPIGYKIRSNQYVTFKNRKL